MNWTWRVRWFPAYYSAKKEVRGLKGTSWRMERAIVWRGHEFRWTTAWRYNLTSSGNP